MSKYHCGPGKDHKQFNIDLPETPSRIGVMFSGGADSTILLFLICRENKLMGNIHTIVPMTVPKVDGAEFYSKRVLDYFAANLGYALPSPILVGNMKSTHDKLVSSGIAETMAFGFVDVLYVGENQNPPDEFPMKGMYPNRLKSNPYNEKKVVFPFLPLYKTHTISLYFQFGLSKLLAITHSCTAGPFGRCMECFACDERKWAFDQLKRVDKNAYPN
jgi:hypothetical protein